MNKYDMQAIVKIALALGVTDLKVQMIGPEQYKVRALHDAEVTLGYLGYFANSTDKLIDLLVVKADEQLDAVDVEDSIPF